MKTAVETYHRGNNKPLRGIDQTHLVDYPLILVTRTGLFTQMSFIGHMSQLGVLWGNKTQCYIYLLERLTSFYFTQNQYFDYFLFSTVPQQAVMSYR